MMILRSARARGQAASGYLAWLLALLLGAVVVTPVAWKVGALGVKPVMVGGAVLALCVAVVGTYVLAHRPWLAPWAVLPLFCTTAELQLRVTGAIGASKDALTALLFATTAYQLARRPELRRRLWALKAPLFFVLVVIGLYFLNPKGSPVTGWIFGTRLFVQAVLLLLIGLSVPETGRATRHLLGALTAVSVLEAVMTIAQQAAGEQDLVYKWGYAFGSQVRLTSGGGLRVSGTFNDPFQLMAVGVLAAVAGVFAARGWQRWVLVACAGVITWGTSVRTALIQLAVLLLLLIWTKGWRAFAVAVCVVGLSAGILVGLSIQTTEYPGAPSKPLLLGLNGRTTAWSLAVKGPESFVFGNGVGAVGAGSTRGAAGLTTQASQYNPKKESKKAFAGDNAFLDSAYLQVQSDTGIVGTLAFLMFVGSLGSWLVQRLSLSRYAEAAFALLVTCALDWVGRATFASYTTGFLTLYVLGIWVAAAYESVDDVR